MAEWSVISISRLDSSVRVNPEYFRPTYQKLEEDLRYSDPIPLVRIADITDGIHTSPDVDETGVTYISAKCVKPDHFDIDDALKISRVQNERNPRTQLREGDVIITTVGTIGNAAVVPTEILPANCDRHVGIIRVKQSSLLSPHYLSVFLNSKYGYFQSKKHTAGNVQPNLYIESIKKILVPRMPTQERQITELAEEGYRQRKEADNLFKQAQSLLESELGLDKLAFDKPVSYTARFSEVAASHRLDAGHYRPRYAQLIQHLKQGQWAYLGQLAEKNWRGVQPVYVEDGEVDVVNSQHLGRQHLDYDAFAKTARAAFVANPEAHIRYGDILIYSTGAYIGRTNVYLSDKPALASNHVHIVRLRGDIDPAYMAMVLSSPVGAFQTEKHARGSAQAELYPSDIAKFVVPLIDPDKQKAIGDLVRESLAAQQESKRLLEQAKHRVEALIEEAIAA